MPNWCYNKYVFYSDSASDSDVTSDSDSDSTSDSTSDSYSDSTSDSDCGSGDERKDELQRLHNKLSATLQTPSNVKNDFEPGWLGKVAIGHGFDWQQISCRGYIGHLGEIEQDGNFSNRSYFTLEVETAWAPTDALWEAIVEQYDGVSYVYLAEEAGNQIFTNTDATGLYFPERYLLEICGDAQIPEGWYAGQDDSDMPDISDMPNRSARPDKSGYLDIRKYFNSLDELVDYCEKLTGKQFGTFEEWQDYISDVFDGEDNTIAKLNEFTPN